MWYNRQVAQMDGAYSEKSERVDSGQAGKRQGALQRKAAESGENVADLEKEWDVIAELKSLHEDAKKLSIQKKDTATMKKAVRNQELPDAVMKMACDDAAVRRLTIIELERRMKKYAQEESTLSNANRLQVMTPQQIKERKMLEELKKRRREEKSEGASGQSGDDEPETSDANKGRGNNNLKKTMDMMIGQMREMSGLLREDTPSEQTLELTQVNRCLSNLDEDIATRGLKLEKEERSAIRMMFLKQYANHSISAIRREKQ
jgi:hypothetical protein